MVALHLRVDRVAVPGSLHTTSGVANTYIGAYPVSHTHSLAGINAYAVTNPHTYSQGYSHTRAHVGTNAYAGINSHAHSVGYAYSNIDPYSYLHRYAPSHA